MKTLRILCLLLPALLQAQGVQTNRPHGDGVSQRSLSEIYSDVVPTITSFSPTSGPIGTTVTITGTNFNTTAVNNVVYFGAVKAQVLSAVSNQLLVTVPVGATYQPITVTDITTGLTAYSAQPFTVIFPSSWVIESSSFSPKVDFTTGTYPSEVVIGDVDGDGKTDMVVANNNSNTVSVFRNTSASGSITSGSFAAKIDFTAAGNPFGLAFADIDGDGKPDLVVANQSGNSVSVFRNTSTSGSITAGSFAAKVDFTTGLLPSEIAIADIDGDGRPDLAVANVNSNTVSVFRNTSTSGSITTGSFAAKVDFSAGIHPWRVAIADIDGDGKPDLAVVSKYGNTVSVFRNTSTSGSITSGSFASNVDFTTGANSYGLSIADLDGDGKPDLVVTSFSSNTVSVFRNTSTSGGITAGSFAAKVDFTTGSDPSVIAIADMDGDGKPDVVVANSGSNTVSALQNTCTSGSISFAAKVDFNAGTSPWCVAIGDVDGDGKPDIAVANYNSNSISVLRNTVSSALSQPPTITSFTPTYDPIGTTVTITGTNFNSTAANNVVWFGAVKATVNSATSTSLTVTVPVSATYAPITVTDITIGLTAYSSKPFTVTFPSSRVIDNSSFTPKVDFTTGSIPNGVALADVDGDGKPDLVINNSGDNTVSVFRNTSTSGSITTGSFATMVDFTTGVNPTAVVLADIDGDGKPDMVVANSGSGIVSVFHNTSTSGSITTGSFATKVDLTTGGSPYGIAIADIDYDGKPDLAIINSGDNTVSVLRNTSTSGSITSGSFATKVDFTTGVIPTGVAIADIDGDGKPDMVIINSRDNTVSVFRNTSTSGSITTGSFATKVDFTTGGIPMRVALADIDDDGKQDIVVTNFGSNSVSVFRNTSTSGSITSGSFATKVDFTTGGVPMGVAIADIDGDGKPDMVVANDNSNTVSVLRNTVATNHLPVANAGPDQTVEQTSSSGAEVTLDGSASSDPDGDALTYLWKEGTTILGTIVKPTVTLSAGAHNIILTVDDGKGASNSDTVIVNIVDTTPPRIVVSGTPTILWPVNHKYITINISKIVVSVSDLGTPSIPISGVSIYSVSSDEPANTGGDGNTNNDIVISSGAKAVNLRAERQGGGNGRVYTINLVVRDASGNVGQASYEVWVPKSQGDKNVINDGPAYTVLANSSIGKEALELSLLDSDQPSEFKLHNNYPNPFNPSTTIRYGLPSQSKVRLIITTTLGQEVAVLENGEEEAGYHEVEWRANVASGIYYYRIDAVSTTDPNNRFVQVKKMLLLK